MKTYAVKANEIERAWHVIDAEGQTLGRLASHVATLLKGKHKPIYSTHLNTGDFVIIVNAEKVHTTGNKVRQKRYYRHTQYPGGLRSTWLGRQLEVHPTRVLEHAIKGMLPHNALGRDMYRKLKVYAGPVHPHQAQVSVGRDRGDAANEE